MQSLFEMSFYFATFHLGQQKQTLYVIYSEQFWLPQGSFSCLCEFQNYTTIFFLITSHRTKTIALKSFSENGL